MGGRFRKTRLAFKAIGFCFASGTGYYWFNRLTDAPQFQSTSLLSAYYANGGSDPAPPTHGYADIAVVGGGILGVTVARELRRKYPKLSVALIEKEPAVAVHQSAHNSGVIHAGIYDAEDSLKTKLCIKGNDMMVEFCKKHNVPMKNVGKLVVATDESEVESLEGVHRQALANGAKGVRLIEQPEISSMEPNVKAIKALYCPSTGIADYAELARTVYRLLLEENKSNGKFRFIPRFQVEGIGTKSSDGRIAIIGKEPGQQGPSKVIECKKLITCAGLHMDTVARLAGGAHQPTIIPFRGRYYELKGDAKKLVTANIYPVPTKGGIPTGVHFTPTVNVERGEQLIIGPGAAIATHKEGYRLDNISLFNLTDNFFSIGNWTFLAKFFPTAVEAMHQDISRAAFVADAQRLVPSLKDSDVIESYAGVMAQVFGSNGMPLRDFAFESTYAPEFPHGGVPVKTHDAAKHKLSRVERNAFHVRHAPSPAATSAFALAEEIVARAHREIYIG